MMGVSLPSQSVLLNGLAIYFNIKEGLTMDNNVDIREIKAEEVARLPVITVVGVGGGGNNTVCHLARTGTFSDIQLMIANTDFQHMQNSRVKKILLGKKGSSGHGAGSKPEKGKEAAEESYENIVESLRGSDLVVISAGLGGGTGTGASPIFAKAAKECGALTVAVVTKPFISEGSKRERLAMAGLKELYAVCDSIVVIPNQKLLSVIAKNTSYKESMSYVDDVAARAVNGISSVILSHSDDGINVDFEDLRTIMSHRGLALMGIGEATGENAAEEAVRNAIESPLFGNMSINGSMGVIVNYEFNPEYPFYAIEQSMQIIGEAANDDADIIFGTMMREEFDSDTVKVSIIATGFEQSQDMKNIDIHNSKTKVVESNPQQEQAQSTPKESQYTPPSVFIHRVKISNSDLTEDELDTPTYLRNQKD